MMWSKEGASLVEDIPLKEMKVFKFVILCDIVLILGVCSVCYLLLDGFS